jgi:hypothetical protein
MNFKELAENADSFFISCAVRGRIQEGVKHVDSLPPVCWSKVSITKSHLNVLVTKKFLDCRKAHACHDQLRGKCIATVMKPEIFYACPF